MPALQPSTDQIRAFARDTHTGPILMINLLRFKPRAEYQPEDPEHGEDISGREAYARYGAALAAFSDDETIGLEMIGGGAVQRFLIGDGDWDAVMLVRYPSRQHFLNMIGDPRYTKAHRHRDAGLLHQDLIETRPATQTEAGHRS